MPGVNNIPCAGIFGIAGTVLTEEEKRLFARIRPLGFILFTRNCSSPGQVRQLVDDLRTLPGHETVFILIDQEGGRVARLKPPHWRKSPPAAFFGTLTDNAPYATYANARLIARELLDLGINVDCAPLVDVPVEGAHSIIGDRAYSRDPAKIIPLAAEMARGLLEGGVLPVLKHIPGHGRAHADSHEELPVVHASLETLRGSDFIPFRALSHLPLGMTAHVLYTAIDPNLPATLSPIALRLIREELGFDGLLMSDDLSMKALGGSFTERAGQTLAAGCDLVLHCNGDMQEMQEVAQATTPLSDKACERFARAASQLKPPTEFDYAKAEKYFTTA